MYAVFKAGEENFFVAAEPTELKFRPTRSLFSLCIRILQIQNDLYKRVSCVSVVNL